MLPWKPQCGENQLRGGFIVGVQEKLQQQKKWKFLTEISSNLSHSFSAKNGPAKLLYGPGTMCPVLPSKYNNGLSTVRPVLFQPSTACTTAGWYGLCMAWLAEVFGPDLACCYLQKMPRNRPVECCYLGPEFGLLGCPEWS
jgi:hypothetical protein